MKSLAVAYSRGRILIFSVLGVLAAAVVVLCAPRSAGGDTGATAEAELMDFTVTRSRRTQFELMPYRGFTSLVSTELP